MGEIQRKSEFKNVVLEKKLDNLTGSFHEKQAQLSEVLQAAKLDPAVVASVTKKLEQVLGSKNRLIKDLEYQVDQSTKCYNDTIRVYESKLPVNGIPGEDWLRTYPNSDILDARQARHTHCDEQDSKELGRRLLMSADFWILETF